MNIRSFLVYIGLFIGVFSFSLIGYISGVNADTEKEKIVTTSEKSAFPDACYSDNNSLSKLAEKFKESYILRENENKVSLFIRYSNGDEQIHSEYEIAVNLLPKSDREQLQEGIEFDSVNDVMKFIEDYMG